MRRLNKNILIVSLFVICVSIITACGPSETAEQGEVEEKEVYVSTPKKHRNLAAKTDTSVFAIIEIPSGSNKMLNFSTKSGKIEEPAAEDDKLLNFLPFPGNFGFVPKTKRMDNPIDIIVLSRRFDSGELVNTFPIGAIKLKAGPEEKFVIVAVPVNEKDRTIKALNFQDFFTTYDSAKFILEQWFANYQGYGNYKIESWVDERTAYLEVENFEITEKK